MVYSTLFSNVSIRPLKGGQAPRISFAMYVGSPECVPQEIGITAALAQRYEGRPVRVINVLSGEPPQHLYGDITVLDGGESSPHEFVQGALSQNDIRTMVGTILTHQDSIVVLVAPSVNDVDLGSLDGKIELMPANASFL